MSVVLCLSFDLENVDCCSYRVEKKETWLRAKRIILRDNVSVQAYSNPSPMELYGDTFEGKDLIQRIDVVDDIDRVKAFETFYRGKVFFTGTDLLGELFEKIKERLTEEEETEDHKRRGLLLHDKVKEAERRWNSYNDSYRKDVEDGFAERLGIGENYEDDLESVLGSYESGNYDEVEALLKKLGIY